MISGDNRHRSKLIHTNGGFTLLEVMVAVSILAIALSVLYGSQSKSVSLATEARFNTLAPILAAGKFAELESEMIVEGSDNGDFGEEYPGFAWSFTAEKAEFENLDQLDLLDAPLLKTELTVTWSDTNYRYSQVYYGVWDE